MKWINPRGLRRIALALALALPVIGIVIWYWVIPAAIVAAIRERHTGYVAISGWWINGASAGVTGLALHETPDPKSPTWAAADRVATDLSIGALLHGRFAPRRIVFERASVAYRINADGYGLTIIPMNQSGGGPIPELVVRDGTLAMRQEGREEMVIHHLNGTLGPDPAGPRYQAKADDPDWGHPAAEGRFTEDFAGYTLHLTADHLPADLEKARRIPFVEEKVWDYVQPKGPVGVALEYRYAPPVHRGGDVGAGGDPAQPGSSTMITTAIFQGDTVALPSLDLVGEDATGRLTVQDKIVTLEGVRGRMCGGRVEFAGPMDFQHKPDRYDLALKLHDVDLTALPESWQLHRIGVRGRFTGTAGLHLSLRADGIDLTGTTGAGVVDGAEIRGIPLKRLDLTLKADGLRDSAGRAKGGEPSGKEGPFLPQWVRGEFRVKDVALDRALARPETPQNPRGGPAVAITGRVDLAATVQFPLGSLEDWRAYLARGDLDVAGAQIGGLDLGRLRGRLDMAGGVVEIADIRGRMVDRPSGGGPPPATEPPSAEGPLPRGGFRGRVRARVVGDRDLRVELEGAELPIAEMAAAAPTFSTSRPASASPPQPLPLSGRVTIRGSGHSVGADPSDPRSWTASGRIESPEVAYQDTVIKDIATDLSVDRGRLVLPDVKGRVRDTAFRGRAEIDLAGPYAYEAEVTTGTLTIRDLLGMVPHVSGTFKSNLSGTVAGQGRAEGTLQPWRITSSGRAQAAGLRVGRLAIGDLPLRWATQGETIVVTAEEHQRYGGLVRAEARVPVAGDRPIEGSVTLSHVDAAEFSAGVDTRDTWKLTGHADGRGTFRYTPKIGGGQGPPIEAEAHLTAPDLKVGGIPARSVRLNLTVHEGDPKYELTADGLGGHVRVAGDGHLASDPKEDEFRARVEAIGLELFEVWGVMGIGGAVADLRGRATVKGEGRTRGGLDLAHAQGRGTVELDEPIWGFDYRLGGKVTARVSQDPGGWRVGPLGGDLFGGRLLGEGIWMARGPGGRERYGADVRVERLRLDRLLSFLPEADRRFAAAGTLRVSGRGNGDSGGTLEYRVDRGQINGLHLSDLRVPGAWTISSDARRRGSLHVQRAEGRIAGGRVGGEAHFALGDHRDFRVRLTVDDVDLRIISREEMGTRSVPGRLSGYLNLHGTDPSNPVSYRGDMEFDLDQASLLDIPLLDELDRQLGSTGGGVFDDGDMHGTIIERKVHIDHLTLVGPLAQVHAQGTMDFDGRLNLEVVVNNNRGVYQSGQAMLARAPSVADEVARRAGQIDQVRDFVSSRLMKFRITGTVRDPIVNVDRSINPRAALGFFLKTMRLSAQSR